MLGLVAGWGLCGIALDEGGEVFGDAHVVCVCLGHQLTFCGCGDAEGEGGGFGGWSLRWSPCPFLHMRTLPFGVVDELLFRIPFVSHSDEPFYIGGVAEDEFYIVVFLL